MLCMISFFFSLFIFFCSNWIYLAVFCSDAWFYFILFYFFSPFKLYSNLQSTQSYYITQIYKTGYVGYRFFFFFLVSYIFFISWCSTFLWYITHFICKWFHQWGGSWSNLVKVVQVESEAWCRGVVRTQKVSWMKTDRIIFHWCHTWENITALKQRWESWVMESRAVTSFCLVCLCVRVCVFKPYCNFFSPLF